MCLRKGGIWQDAFGRPSTPPSPTSCRQCGDSDSDRQTKFFQLRYPPLHSSSRPPPIPIRLLPTRSNVILLKATEIFQAPQKPRREGPSSISFCPSFPIQGARAIRNRNILCCNVFPIPSGCSAPPCSSDEAPVPHPCEAGSATQKPVVSTSAEYSLRLAGEADNLSTRSRPHWQTTLPPLAWHHLREWLLANQYSEK